jgi:hypothetical protein
MSSVSRSALTESKKAAHCRRPSTYQPIAMKGAKRRQDMSQQNRITSNVEALFHPVSHYASPRDVLDELKLSTEEKRLILSSWASDMYAVESHPALREIPGIPHRIRLDDILAALKQLDGENDPPPRGGLAMRLPRFSKLECTASDELRRFGRKAATRRHRPMPAARKANHSRWTREANVRRYRKLLNTQLTEVERTFVERRLAEELRYCSVPLNVMEGIDVCQL